MNALAAQLTTVRERCNAITTEYEVLKSQHKVRTTVRERCKSVSVMISFSLSVITTYNGQKILTKVLTFKDRTSYTCNLLLACYSIFLLFELFRTCILENWSVGTGGGCSQNSFTNKQFEFLVIY